jgi:FkbM family methyltransferase
VGGNDNAHRGLAGRAQRLAALVKPTSGSLGEFAGNLNPAVVWKKLGSRREWLDFARRVDVVPMEGLVQLGTAYGGYAVPGQLIGPDWICYSGGLGEDVSFELELTRRYGCVVETFDPVPRSAAFMSSVVESNPLIRFHPWGLWSSDSTQRFFTPADPAHVSYSIANLQGTEAFIDVECRSVPSLMKEFGHERLDLLKLDIEGAEYAVLDSLLEARIIPTVLCVDVHRVGSVADMAALIGRLRESGLRPVHVYRSDVTLVAASHFS